ncbi:MAG: DNA cytosine methyltransferase [Chloroflexota bacterium]|nr:DNA cytosine methyltransferase [Chloroflexota bacterium]
MSKLAAETPPDSRGLSKAELKDPAVISLFSGALGLDFGLERAGFRVSIAVECNRFAAQTIRLNRPHLPLIEKRLEDVSTVEILEAAGLRVGEATVVTGGPSCQSFSTAGLRRSFEDERGVMFRQFLRVVKEARPRFFVMENVTGVLSAAVQHRPLRERGPGFPKLKREEELGSAFALILRELAATGYYVVFDLVNAADFGVPQTRKRIVFIGSRDGEPIDGLVRTHSVDGRRKWVTLERALRDVKDDSPEFSVLSKSKKEVMRHVPAGGNWRDLPERMAKKALGAAYVSWGGRVGFYRRLAWDEPAPALTTRPDSKATMLCHPSRLRPLTVAEYARLQQFPRRWKFSGGTPQKYIQIGNAVPVGLGEVVGKALLTAMRSSTRVSFRGKVVCLSSDVLRRLHRRPRTVLNPDRMRRRKGVAAAKKWLGDAKKRSRAGLFKHLVDRAVLLRRTTKAA